MKKFPPGQFPEKRLIFFALMKRLRMSCGNITRHIHDLLNNGNVV